MARLFDIAENYRALFDAFDDCDELDDLLMETSSAIDDETGKYDDYDDENGGLNDGKII